MSSNSGGFISRLFIVVLFLLMSIIGICFSFYLFLIATTTYTYFLALAFLLLTVISGFFNVSSSYSYYRSYFYDKYLAKISRLLKPLGVYPTVAVVVPVYNEDPKMVERNLTKLESLNYDKRRIKFYVADDSTKKDITDNIEVICRKKGITFIHRSDRKGFKAGALNNALKQSNAEMIAIFDADEYLTDKNFLIDLLPYFQNKRVAFVQTEKKYAKGTFFSDCVDLFDAFFFKFVQPARALNNTAIFAGSCGIIRRSALDEIGGFPEFVIEDTFFSFESDIKNFKSVYVPKVYALGRPVLTFTELARQQWRYNYGDTQFLFHFLKRRQGTVKKLSALSKMEYTLHGLGLNYLSFMLIMFTLISILIVFASAPVAVSTLKQIMALNFPQLTLEMLGINTFFLSILVPVALTKIYFKSVSKGLLIYVLNFALAFTRLKAAVAAVLSAEPTIGWIKGDRRLMGSIASAFRNSIAEIAFSVILLFSSAVAIFAYNFSGALWLLWYCVLYSSTFFFFLKYG